MKKLEEFIECLEGVPVTVVSGVFLIASLVLDLCSVPVPIYLNPAWVSVILSGLPLLYSAIRKLIFAKGISKISSAMLISCAMIASIALGDLFAAGEVAFIMALGEILEDVTTARASKGLKKLVELTPQTGRIINDGKEEIVPSEMIKAGDMVRLFPGEVAPVDGVIVSGESSFDQSVLTGESLPVDKTTGDEVVCGAINMYGSVDVRATRAGEDTSLSRLIGFVSEAEDKKAKVARSADKWASILVPVALLVAVIFGLVRQDVVVGVTVLVVFCPCAMVLATPTAIMAAIGQATKHGVIIKSGEALETLCKTDIVALDKTGTLTSGKMSVADVYPIGDYTRKQVYALAACAEERSEHPLGKAIVAGAKAENISFFSAESFASLTGKGVVVESEGKKILCGSLRFIESEGGVVMDECRNICEREEGKGKACVCLCVDGVTIGVIALSDTLKPGAKDMVARLKAMGKRVILLSGDNERVSCVIANAVGIDEVHACLLPEQKAQIIENWKSEGHKVCMLGDGVNDALALTVADAGVAMADVGSALAVESADMALVGDDITKFPYLVNLSRAALRTITISISASLVINLVAIVLSFFSLLNPVTGALVHNVGSVVVVLFAALLYDRRIK